MSAAANARRGKAKPSRSNASAKESNAGPLSTGLISMRGHRHPTPPPLSLHPSVRAAGKVARVRTRGNETVRAETHAKVRSEAALAHDAMEEMKRVQGQRPSCLDPCRKQEGCRMSDRISVSRRGRSNPDQMFMPLTTNCLLDVFSPTQAPGRTSAQPCDQIPIKSLLVPWRRCGSDGDPEGQASKANARGSRPVRHVTGSRTFGIRRTDQGLVEGSAEHRGYLGGIPAIHAEAFAQGGVLHAFPSQVVHHGMLIAGAQSLLRRHVGEARGPNR